jgi:hypothetical protein
MSGLFVSNEHKRQSRLRTNKAYHSIVYILISVGLLQIPFGILLVRQRDTAAAHALRKAAALKEQDRLAAAAAPLKDLARKVKDAQSWSECSSQRISTTQILSQLERSVNEGVCFTEITIHNRAPGPRDPDRIEVELQGFAKAPETDAWQHTIESLFPGWNVSAPRIGRLGTAAGPEGLFPFNLLLKQTTSPLTRKASK